MVMNVCAFVSVCIRKCASVFVCLNVCIRVYKVRGICVHSGAHTSKRLGVLTCDRSTLSMLTCRMSYHQQG